MPNSENLPLNDCKFILCKRKYQILFLESVTPQKIDFGANFRKFFFDHLKYAYAAVKLNQITTAGSWNIT